MKKKWKSLSVRLPLLFISSFLSVMLLVVFVIYMRFEKRMIDEYTRMAQGVTKLMQKRIDGDKIDEYIERNFEMAEYNEILDYFSALKENYPDVQFLYVYRMKQDGGHVVFDLYSDTEGYYDPPGTVYELEDDLKSHLDKLCRGEEIPVLIDHTKYGYLLTYLRPVFDSRGNYQCHVCADFSMDYLHEQDIAFLCSILLILAIVVAILLLIDIRLIRKNITGPLKRMVKCADEFAYETEKDRFRNIQLMEELDIHTGDEIQELYTVFLSVLKESIFYMTNLSRAKDDIQDKELKIGQISKKAYKDDLTGVGNKAAYTSAAEKLNQDIAKGTAGFAIVMMDINNLKYVNDNFGHEKGDDYIRGCCTMMCEVYKHSPVFRVGGDEFVAVLQNEEYVNR
jgi:GGDEF domain-containing protein